VLSSNRFMAVCALALVGAVLAIAGCGGSDKKSQPANSAPGSSTTAPASTTPGSGGADVQQYVNGFSKAAVKFDSAIRVASGKLGGATTSTDKLKELDGLRTAVSTAADDFAALQPPPKIKADNDALVQALRRFASDLSAISSSAQKHDPAAAVGATKRIQQGQARIGTIIDSIRAKLAK
jgi:ABC-type phosphate transport system substrate-binding protein